MIIDFIGDKQHFLSRPAKHFGDFAIKRMNTTSHIDDKKYHCSFGYGDLGLPLDLPLKDILRIWHNAAGIDNKEIPPGPIGTRINAVARYAGNRFGNSHPLADKAIKESRLADIRPANDCN